MMGLKARIGNKPYEHIAIDPYGSLEYEHFDNQKEREIRWKRNNVWTDKPPVYPDEMRIELLKKILLIVKILISIILQTGNI